MRCKPWTRESAIADASSYKTKIEWKKTSNSAYAAARKNGWLEEACGHMITLRRKMDKPSVLASAAQHQTRGAWQNSDASAYGIALREGWLDEACTHMGSPRGVLLSKEQVLKSAKLFAGRTEWKDGHLSLIHISEPTRPY